MIIRSISPSKNSLIAATKSALRELSTSPSAFSKGVVMKRDLSPAAEVICAIFVLDARSFETSTPPFAVSARKRPLSSLFNPKTI